jgi:hypothetical protein
MFVFCFPVRDRFVYPHGEWTSLDDSLSLKTRAWSVGRGRVAANVGRVTGLHRRLTTPPSASACFDVCEWTLDCCAAVD